MWNSVVMGGMVPICEVGARSCALTVVRPLALQGGARVTGCVAQLGWFKPCPWVCPEGEFYPASTKLVGPW